MTTIENIQLYSSIKELPIVRYKLMQSYLLQDSGIGSSVEDMDKRIEKSVVFIANDRRDEAKEELTNLRYTVFSMLQGIDYKSKSFSCLVHSINGKECDDLTTEGLEATAKQIEGISVESLEKHFDEIKKKLISNFQ